jgi:hypothetical protein
MIPALAHQSVLTDGCGNNEKARPWHRRAAEQGTGLGERLWMLGRAVDRTGL